MAREVTSVGDYIDTGDSGALASMRMNVIFTKTTTGEPGSLLLVEGLVCGLSIRLLDCAVSKSGGCDLIVQRMDGTWLQLSRGGSHPWLWLRFKRSWVAIFVEKVLTLCGV